MSYLSDLDVEYDHDGEIEVEVENDDSGRGQLRERGQQLLQDLNPGHVLDLLGR